MLRHLEVDRAGLAHAGRGTGTSTVSDKRRVAGRDGFLDRGFGHGARTARHRPGTSEARRVPRQATSARSVCGRGEAHDRPGSRSCTSGRELAISMCHALHRERREQDRQARPPCRARSSPSRCRADVDEDARTQLAALEGGDVVAERDLVSGPAGKVGVRVCVELLFGEALVVPDVDRLVGHVGEPNGSAAPKEGNPPPIAADGFQCRGV